MTINGPDAWQEFDADSGVGRKVSTWLPRRMGARYIFGQGPKSSFFASGKATYSFIRPAGWENTNFLFAINTYLRIKYARVEGPSRS